MIKEIKLLTACLIGSSVVANETDTLESAKESANVVSYMPTRISAEFPNDEFPDHIHSILIYDNYQGKNVFVGELTPETLRQGARWTITDAYHHESEKISLCYKVITAGESLLRDIPPRSTKGHEDHIIPTILSNHHKYLAAVRISFSGNENVYEGLRASYVMKNCAYGSVTSKQFESTKADITVEVGCPENNPEVFNAIMPIHSIVDNEKYIVIEESPEVKISEVVEDMLRYISKCDGIELDITKLAQSFCQKGCFRSNLIPEFIERVNAALAAKNTQ